jgi:hypothetical protein
MKQLIILLAIIPLTIFVKAQSKEWKEEKAFHSLMSSSFHPAEEGNFKPLKQKADSLVIASKAWQASAIPANYKIKETKEELQKLVAQCIKIQTALKANATNEELKKQITEAHEIFHHIVGECKKND